MSKQVFINLPVANLSKSMAFYEALGFSRNPQFTGDYAGCIVISDTSKAVEVLLNLTCESREEVDSLVAKALAAGGSTYDKPEDFGFMYTHSFVDPDGHGWGLFHMNATPT